MFRERVLHGLKDLKSHFGNMIVELSDHLLEVVFCFNNVNKQKKEV